MDLNEPCIDHGQAGNDKGYGRVWRNGRNVGAHVMALITATGEEANGRFALHSCDNPRCVNPKHLRWGSAKDNMLDMVKRGRGAGIANFHGKRSDNRGENHGRAKLTEAMVLQIREIYSEGKISQRKLAERFGISKTTMGAILIGKLWNHI